MQVVEWQERIKIMNALSAYFNSKHPKYLINHRSENFGGLNAEIGELSQRNQLRILGSWKLYF